MEKVTNYIEVELPQFLKRFNIPESGIENIKEDIFQRICSLLQLWNDEKKRRSLLTLGLEEAIYYEPLDAPIEIKAFVVMTIRNSEIENLMSTNTAAAIYGFSEPPIPDEYVKDLTWEAIEYFRYSNFEKLSDSIKQYYTGENIYLPLFDNYPIASKCLEELGAWANKGKTFLKLPKIDNPDELLLHVETSNAPIKNGVWLQSGIDKTFNPELLKAIKAITTQESKVLYIDSFKAFTRNVEKLLIIIEYILQNDGIFATTNFYLTNGYVSKRKKLQRPMHNSEDSLINLQNIDGLSKTHLKVIEREQQKRYK